MLWRLRAPHTRETKMELTERIRNAVETTPHGGDLRNATRLLTIHAQSWEVLTDAHAWSNLELVAAARDLATDESTPEADRTIRSVIAYILGDPVHHASAL